MNYTHTPVSAKDRTDLKKGFRTALIAMGSNPAEFSMDFNGATVDVVLRLIADLETAEQSTKILTDACQGIPAEALTPGSVKLLVDALESEFKIDTHLAGCKICDPYGFCEEGKAMSDAATILKQRALAPFKGAQEVKADVVSG